MKRWRSGSPGGLQESRRSLDERSLDERGGNIAIIVILALPALVGAFFFAVDIQKNIYLRSGIQSALDTAVAGGASLITTYYDRSEPGSVGVIRIEEREEPFRTIERLYDYNRPPGLTCLTSSTTPPGSLSMATPQRRLCYRRVDTSVGSSGESEEINDTCGATRSGVFYIVEERSRNFLLAYIGSGQQVFTITARACIKASNR